MPTDLNMSPEDQFLVYCARVSIDDETSFKIKEILSNRLDWDYIVKSSKKHCISQLLYWNLGKLDFGKYIPENILISFKKMYQSNLLRNMYIYQELYKILKAFKEAEIDVIVLKGAFLAWIVYKDIGTRLMCDIDLLIRKDDLQRVDTELSKLKYSHGLLFTTKLHEKLQTVFSTEKKYISDDKILNIDVHWDIQPVDSHFKIDVNALWRNAVPFNIIGVESLVLAPEDFLLHLCLHIDKHINDDSAPSPNYIKSYCDIASIITHYYNDIEWDYLLKISDKYDIVNPIYENIYISCKFFGAPLPENIFKKISSVNSEGNFEKIMRDEIINDMRQKEKHIEYYYLWQLKKINGLLNKIFFIMGNMFPSKEFMVRRYSIKNDYQLYVCYLIRIGIVLLYGLAYCVNYLRSFFKTEG